MTVSDTLGTRFLSLEKKSWTRNGRGLDVRRPVLPPRVPNLVVQVTLERGSPASAPLRKP